MRIFHDGFENFEPIFCSTIYMSPNINKQTDFEYEENKLSIVSVQDQVQHLNSISAEIHNIS